MLKYVEIDGIMKRYLPAVILFTMILIGCRTGKPVAEYQKLRLNGQLKNRQA